MLQRKSELKIREALGVVIHPFMILMFLPISIGLGALIGCLGSAITGNQIWFAIGLVLGQAIVTGVLAVTGLFDWAAKHPISSPYCHLK